MKQIKLAVALTGLISLVALPTIAADNGFYLGASVGQSMIDIENIAEGDGGDFSGDDVGYKVFAGYRFLTFLSVEASYRDFGAPDEQVSGGDGTIEAKISGFDAFAVGYLPLGIADIFVKVGMINWDADVTALVDGHSETFSNDGTDPAYGFGVQFRISSFAIRAEAEYFDVEAAQDVLMVSIGGSYTF